MEGFKKTISVLLLSAILAVLLPMKNTMVQGQTPDPNTPVSEGNEYKNVANCTFQPEKNVNTVPRTLSDPQPRPETDFVFVSLLIDPNHPKKLIFTMKVDGTQTAPSFDYEKSDNSFLYFKSQSQSTKEYLLFPLRTPGYMEYKEYDNQNQEVAPISGTRWEWFNYIEVKPTCKAFPENPLNAEISRGDTVGRDGAPKISLPANSDQNRPKTFFVFRHLAIGQGAFNRGGEFYFTYAGSEKSGQIVQEPRFENYAVKATIGAVGSNAVLRLIVDKDPLNPGDDSDNVSASVWESPGVQIENDPLYASLVNRVYNKKDGTKVGPPPHTVNSAEYNPSDRIFNIDSASINLNGYGSIPNIPADQIQTSPIGWLKSWEIDINATSLLSPTGQENQYCKGYAMNIISGDLGKAFEGAVCNMLAFLHKLSAGLFDWAMEWLKKAIGFQTSIN